MILEVYGSVRLCRIAEIEMPWTEIIRQYYERKTDRYASDTFDEERAIVERHLPARNRLCRPRKIDFGEIWDAIQ